MMAVTYLNLVYIFRSWGIIIITGFSNIRFMEGGGSWGIHDTSFRFMPRSCNVCSLLIFASQSYSSFDSFH